MSTTVDAGRAEAEQPDRPSSCLFPPNAEQQSGWLEALIISELDGDILPLPTASEIDGRGERVTLAVFRSVRMTPERWDRLSPAERIPWLRETLNVLRTKDAANPTESNAAPRAASDADNRYRKKNVNARMLEKMQADPSCHGWTCRKWAEFLGCKEASVVATLTWQNLAQTRDKLKAERARDRRGPGVGRRRGDFGDG